MKICLIFFIKCLLYIKSTARQHNCIECVPRFQVSNGREQETLNNLSAAHSSFFVPVGAQGSIMKIHEQREHLRLFIIYLEITQPAAHR